MTDYNFPQIIGEDEVLNERSLLTGVQNGMMMRDHKARGFRTIGYHFYIRRSGELSQHRRLLEVGAHAKGYNRCSIAVCYEGGLNTHGQPADTRTEAQKTTLRTLLQKLHTLFPQALVLGHRDLPGVKKDCPCYDVI